MTVGAGTTGPDLATRLGARGLTIGHEPQSWELATVGGWVAARGSGLRSLGSGRIEQLFAGGMLEAPGRDARDAAVPRLGGRSRTSASSSSARRGGSGILTDVVLRAIPLPERGPPRCLGAAGLGGRPRARARARPGPASGSRASPLDPHRDAGRSSPSRTGPRRSAALPALPPRPPPSAGLGAAAGRRGRAASASPRRPGRRPDRSSARTAASRSPPSRRPGRGPASARRTCATRCGRSATARTRSRPRPTGRASRRCSRASRPPSARARRPSRRAGPRVHPPLAPVPVRLEPLPHVPVPARAGSRRDARALADDQAGGVRDDLAPRARRSPTTTAWASTTRRTSPRRRARSAWRRSRQSSARSIRRA